MSMEKDNMQQSSYHMSKEQLKNEMLLVQMAQNNVKEFGPLYNKYYKQIFVFVIRRTEDEVIAADVTSNVFIKAMKNIKKFKFKGFPFSAWLYRIASNEVSQYYRNNKKERIVYCEQQALIDMGSSIKEKTIEDQEEAEILSKSLLDVLQILSTKEMELIELRFFEKKPFKEIGNILDITENNAKVRIYRILTKLRGKINSSNFAKE